MGTPHVLRQTFRYHPYYQGQTYGTVWAALTAQAHIDQQAQAQLDADATASSPRHAIVQLVAARWIAVGGEVWMHLDPGYLAAGRLKIEVVADRQFAPWFRRLLAPCRRPLRRWPPHAAVTSPTGNPQFLHHPVYQGWSYQQVWAALLREAKEAQWRYAILACRPDREAVLICRQLDAVWEEYGGHAWRSIDPMHLAAEVARQEWAWDLKPQRRFIGWLQHWLLGRNRIAHLPSQPAKPYTSRYHARDPLM